MSINELENRKLSFNPILHCEMRPGVYSEKQLTPGKSCFEINEQVKERQKILAEGFRIITLNVCL